MTVSALPSVLHLVWGFSSGGTENQLLQLVRSQRAGGAFAVHLAALRRVGPLLPDFEAAVVNILALDEKAVVGQIVSKIERVKARIANLDCILRKRRIESSGPPTEAVCTNP